MSIDYIAQADQLASIDERFKRPMSTTLAIRVARHEQMDAVAPDVDRGAGASRTRVSH
jgi:hypothetical protein